MATETHVKVSGQWRKLGAEGVYVKVGGAWQDVNFIYAKAGGDWKTVYIKDITGPAAITVASATWNGNALRIVWTDPPDSDLDYVRVHIRPGSGNVPRIYGPNINGGVQSYNFTDYIIDNTTYTVFLRPYDIYGNAGPETSFESMAWTGASRGRTPLFQWFDPQDSCTYLNGGIIAADRVYQGWNASGGTIGMFTYGNQLWDKLRGASITSANFETGRVNAQGKAGAVIMEPRASLSKTTAASPVEISGTKITTAGSLCRDGSCPWWIYQGIPSNWFPHMTASALGSTMGTIHFFSDDTTLQPSLGNVSNSYMQMYAAGEAPGTITPGRINVHHSG